MPRGRPGRSRRSGPISTEALLRSGAGRCTIAPNAQAGPRAIAHAQCPTKQKHEERTNEIQGQAVFERSGDRPRRGARGRAGGAAGADRRRHRQRRYWRRGHRRQRTGGRGMGDRGDHRSADPLRQDGGHGRPGPLRGARSPQSQVQGVGARLWPRRLAEGRRRAGQAGRSQGGAGAERGGGRAVLSGDLLVLDAEDPRRQPVRRQE